MLGQAMQEVEPEEASSVALLRSPALRVDPRFRGLDSKYHRALAGLLGQPSLSKLAFETIAREHSLMPSGMLDAINEWAFEEFDDPIIEERDSEFTIRLDFITESP